MSSTTAGILFLASLIIALAAVHVPLGDYIYRVYDSSKDWRAERVAYRLIGADSKSEQTWGAYARSLLAFSAVSVVFLFILQLAQLTQVISPLNKRFDVSVKHRACAAAAHRMPGAMHVEPFSRGFLTATDLVAHDRIEDLGTTTGDRTKPGFAQKFQRISNRHLENSLGQVASFDGSKCFYMQLRIKRAQSFQQLDIPIFFQTRMQSADHVHLGDAQGERIGHGLNNFVNRVFECVGVAFFGGKRAELAG